LVSPELRTRIASGVRHLKWIPDGRARALATRRTGTIGAVFPTLSHGDFARAIEALQQELNGLGYTLLLACSEYQPEQEYQQVRKLVERGVDAVILVGEAHDAALTEFHGDCGVPYVNTFVYNPQNHGTCIAPTTTAPSIVSPATWPTWPSAVRCDRSRRNTTTLQGIRDPLAERSIAVRPLHFVVGLWGIAEAREYFRRIFKQEPWPTALIRGNAYLTVGAVLEAAAQSIDVPGQLSIVGYDDIEIMRELPIPITTVRVLSDEVGRRAAQVLVASSSATSTSSSNALPRSSCARRPVPHHLAGADTFAALKRHSDGQPLYDGRCGAIDCLVTGWRCSYHPAIAEGRERQRFLQACGRSSVVEHQLPKLSVEGSIPFARSNAHRVRPGQIGHCSDLMWSTAPAP
jgi:LacI family transcriptional regulator, galactose operon repressor